MALSGGHHQLSGFIVLLSGLRRIQCPLCVVFRKNGAIVFGDIIGRRRMPRLSIDMAVEIRHGQTVSPCRVRDVSAGGLGLSGVYGLKPNEEVAIQLEAGRTIRGTVAWTRDGQAGVALTEELEHANPLLDWASSWPASA